MQQHSIHKPKKERNSYANLQDYCTILFKKQKTACNTKCRLSIKSPLLTVLNCASLYTLKKFGAVQWVILLANTDTARTGLSDTHTILTAVLDSKYNLLAKMKKKKCTFDTHISLTAFLGGTVILLTECISYIDTACVNWRYTHYFDHSFGQFNE